MKVCGTCKYEGTLTYSEVGRTDPDAFHIYRFCANRKSEKHRDILNPVKDTCEEWEQGGVE